MISVDKEVIDDIQFLYPAKSEPYEAIETPLIAFVSPEKGDVDWYTTHSGKWVEIYLLSQMKHPKYKLLNPLSLSVETDGEIIVSDSHLNVYGVGNTIEEATNEYSSMLIDLYEELESSEDVLSSHLRQQLDYLRNILTLR